MKAKKVHTLIGLLGISLSGCMLFGGATEKEKQGVNASSVLVTGVREKGTEPNGRDIVAADELLKGVRKSMGDPGVTIDPYSDTAVAQLKSQLERERSGWESTKTFLWGALGLVSTIVLGSGGWVMKLRQGIQAVQTSRDEYQQMFHSQVVGNSQIKTVTEQLLSDPKVTMDQLKQLLARDNINSILKNSAEAVGVSDKIDDYLKKAKNVIPQQLLDQPILNVRARA